MKWINSFRIEIAEIISKHIHWQGRFQMWNVWKKCPNYYLCNDDELIEMSKWMNYWLWLRIDSCNFYDTFEFEDELFEGNFVNADCVIDFTFGEGGNWMMALEYSGWMTGLSEFRFREKNGVRWSCRRIIQMVRVFFHHLAVNDLCIKAPLVIPSIWMRMTRGEYSQIPEKALKSQQTQPPPSAAAHVLGSQCVNRRE